jgi:hypothetical protein
MGRFISPDTIIPHPFNPQSFNRYSYCLNNPLKYIDPSEWNVFIAGIGDVENITPEDFYWFMHMTPEARGEVVNILITYTAFKESSLKAAHMAWTMETSTEHKIYLESSDSADLYAEYNRIGNDHTITFHPHAFLDYQASELGFPLLYGKVDWFILDTHADLDYLDAVKEVAIYELISLSKKLETTVNLLESVWTAKTESPAIAAIELGIAYTPIGPVYTFFSNLIGQQDAYDLFMAYYGIP